MIKRPSLRIQRSSAILWILIALLLVFVILSVTMRRAEEAFEAPPEKASPVHVQTVFAQTVEDLIQLPGRIEPELRSRLAVDKGGRVTEILVDKGDTVHKGQVLLRIDDRIWQAYKENAEIELREAEKEFNRWTGLMETGAVSPSEFDAVRTRFDRARIQLTDATTHVEQCVVRSPADGVINARLIEVGEFAPEGGAVLELVVSDPVRLILNVPERDIAFIRQGASLPYTISVLGDRSFTGTISHVAEAATPASNSYRIEVTTPNPERILRPGMIASAQLLRTRRDEAIVVPLSTVIPRKGEHFTYVVAGDRAVRRLVKIDRILGDRVVLASGLEPGESLITEGHRELIDGALVRVIPSSHNE